MNESFAKIPRIRFANLPTPLEPLPRLARRLGLRTLFIKRDDLTGLAFGGNKTRKLEYFLAEAVAHGAKTLLTAGAVQSNHCRQTAAAAAKFGFGCKLVLTGMEPERISANLLLDKLLGAEIIWCKMEDREDTLQKAFQKEWEEGRRPYLIPYGGSNALGVCGYVAAMFELKEQGIDFDWIVFPSSSGGTQTGMILGKNLSGMSCKVYGFSVDQSTLKLKKKIFDLAQETINNFGFKTNIKMDDIEINDEYIGEGYGKPTNGDLEAIRIFAEEEAVLLDPVYTGRAAAGMIDLVRKGIIPSDSRVLFWHTGGNPALFAMQYEPLLV
jgi:D-cysteine desulfhydrase family pyridoxal phosphate-dependent enzyme